MHSSLRHGLGELRSSKQVKVDVLYGLASVLAYVGDDSVSVGKTACGSNLGYSLKNRGNCPGALGIDSVGRLDMALWHDQHVNGSLRSDVTERVDAVILVYLI